MDEGERGEAEILKILGCMYCALRRKLKKLLLHHLQLVYLVDRKSTIFNQDTYLQGQGPDLSPSDKIDENGKIK